MTYDIVPPMNTEIPGSDVHEITESLAKEIDGTESQEKLQETRPLSTSA